MKQKDIEKVIEDTVKLYVDLKPNSGLHLADLAKKRFIDFQIIVYSDLGDDNIKSLTSEFNYLESLRGGYNIDSFVRLLNLLTTTKTSEKTVNFESALEFATCLANVSHLVDNPKMSKQANSLCSSIKSLAKESRLYSGDISLHSCAYEFSLFYPSKYPVYSNNSRDYYSYFHSYEFTTIIGVLAKTIDNVSSILKGDGIDIVKHANSFDNLGNDLLQRVQDSQIVSKICQVVKNYNLSIIDPFIHLVGSKQDLASIMETNSKLSNLIGHAYSTIKAAEPPEVIASRLLNCINSNKISLNVFSDSSILYSALDSVKAIAVDESLKIDDLILSINRERGIAGVNLSIPYSIGLKERKDLFAFSKLLYLSNSVNKANLS